MAIVLRTTKGVALSYAELDGNFIDLDNRINELADNTATTDWFDILNKPSTLEDFGIQAFNGDYNNLTNTPSIPTNLSDLQDVTNNVPTAGQVLKWSGEAWIPGSGAATDWSVISNTPTTLAEYGISDIDVLGTASFSNVINLPVLDSEPASPTNGTVAIANGVSWNPTGSSEKTMVVYLDGSWRSIAVGGA